MNVAIYARISKDRAGAGLGVERQIEDCEKLAADNGWQVVATYTDNDISAYSGKRRPGYEALLEAINAGEVQVVIAWHSDRLHRRNAELERYIAVCERMSVATHTVKAGALDLVTPAGRAIARTLGAWASYEVETSTARVRAAKLQQAKAGKFSGGQRPFGYEPGCVAIRESEAAVYRELVGAVIGGASFRSLALDLNSRGVTTTNGKLWNALKVRNMLTHKRYCGVREHHDAEYPAVWPAIISRETFDQLQIAIKLHARQYKQLGPARKFLLTGFAYCGKCGNRMNSKPNSRGDSRYVCMPFQEERGWIGCGGISRLIAPVDYLVTECILLRLESPQMAAEIARRQDRTEQGSKLASLLAEQRAQQQRLNEIVDDYATGGIDKREYIAMKDTATTRLEALGREIERLSATHTIGSLPAGLTARSAWQKADLAWRRQVVAMLVEKIVIHPSPGSGTMPNAEKFEGRWRFRPQDIQIVWKA